MKLHSPLQVASAVLLLWVSISSSANAASILNTGVSADQTTWSYTLVSDVDNSAFGSVEGLTQPAGFNLLGLAQGFSVTITGGAFSSAFSLSSTATSITGTYTSFSQGFSLGTNYVTFDVIYPSGDNLVARDGVWDFSTVGAGFFSPVSTSGTVTVPLPEPSALIFMKLAIGALVLSSRRR